LQAVQAAKLDRVYFLPERRPRGKRNVEHFGHRVAMLKHAAAPHPQFDVLEMVDTSFSVKRTLPQLQAKFKNAELVFLFGSDILPRLHAWPQAEQLLKSSELVISLREDDDRQKLKKVVEAWPVPPKALTMFVSYAPKVSSGRVRAALRRRQPAPGLLTSVERYSNHHWLYVSLK